MSEQINYVNKPIMDENVQITKQKLAQKQPKQLETPLTVLGQTETQVEGALDAINNKERVLTYSQYRALTDEEKNNGTTYYISDWNDSGDKEVVEGYYNPIDGKFYEESTYITEIVGSVGCIYIDILTNRLFTWNSTNQEFVDVTNTIPVATTSVDGLMSTQMVTKLNGIASGAEVNQNAFSNVVVGTTTVAAESKTDTLTLEGNNVTLTPDATNDKVTIGITKANVTSALGYTPPTSDTTTGTTYTAGNAPANTTFGTNGSIKNVYDNLNTKISNMNSHNNFVSSNLYFNVNKGNNNVAYFDIVDANGNGYRIGATNEGMWFQYMNNWQYGQYIWTQH